jgi:hypothetical protein
MKKCSMDASAVDFPIMVELGRSLDICVIVKTAMDLGEVVVVEGNLVAVLMMNEEVHLLLGFLITISLRVLMRLIIGQWIRNHCLPMILDDKAVTVHSAAAEAEAEAEEAAEVLEVVLELMKLIIGRLVKSRCLLHLRLLVRVFVILGRILIARAEEDTVSRRGRGLDWFSIHQEVKLELTSL